MSEVPLHTLENVSSLVLTSLQLSEPVICEPQGGPASVQWQRQDAQPADRSELGALWSIRNWSPSVLS